MGCHHAKDCVRDNLIDKIPNEMLAIILGLIGWNNGSTRLVCKKWRECVIKMECVEFANMNADNITSFNMEKIMSGIVKGGVCTLYFDYCQIGDNFGWIECLTNVKNVKFKRCSHLNDVVKKIGKDMLQLERMELLFSVVLDNYINYLSGLVVLRELDLSGCFDITGEYLDKLVGLRVLIIRYCVNVSRIHLGKLVHLEELDFSFSLMNRSDVGFVENMHSLIKINLSHNGLLRNFGGWKNLRYLEEVTMHNCEFETNDFRYLINLDVKKMDCYDSIRVGDHEVMDWRISN